MLDTDAVFFPDVSIFNSSTASTGPSTGAVVVLGGLGVGGAINAGGSMNVAGRYFASEIRLSDIY